MSTKSSITGTKFGEWLSDQIDRRGMNRSEFAQKVGVSKSTMSRWINGDRPSGPQIDIIADVLLLDYDLVSTKAGYRPRALLDLDPDSPTARLMPMIERINWTEERLAKMEMDLRWMIERDREAEKEDL